MGDFKMPNSNGQTIGTPPGMKILKSMAATSSGNHFYLLKAKMSDVVPRISGQSGDFIDLNGEKTCSVDPKEAIWQKIRKTNGAASDGTRDGSESADAKKRASETPGAKLAVLKQALEPKMRQQRKEGLLKRYEMWKTEGGHKKKHKEESNDDLDVSKKIFDVKDIDEPDDEDSNDVVMDCGKLSSTRHDEDSPQKDNAPVKINEKFPEERIEGNTSFIHDDEEKNDFVSPIKADYPIPYQGHRLDDNQGIFNEPSKAPKVISIHSPRIFNRSRSLDDLFCVPGQVNHDRSALPVSPDKSQLDTDNISMTRRLLGRVISEGDSQPPTSQDILAMCSGQFMKETSCSNSHLNDQTDSNSKASCSTPATAKTPRLFYDIFQATPRRIVTHFASSSEKSKTIDETAPQDVLELKEAEKHEDDSLSMDVEEQPKEVAVPRKKRNRLLSDSEDEGDDEESDNEEADVEEDGINSEQESEASDDEEEEAQNVEEREDVDEEELYLRQERERREFFDNEAELSGSDDGGGDDNEDENKDEWEPEAGDLDELPSENELRSQIGRVHWKQMMDEDKRQLLRYKEAYLRDDSDGQAINFRFRFNRNGADSDDDFDTEGPQEGDSVAQDDEELDEGWQESLRQRAKWFTKHGVPVEDILADADDAVKGSHFFNAARAALHRTASASNGATTDQPDAQRVIAQTFSMIHHSVSVDSGATSAFFRRDSLLKRGNSLLEKLASEGGSGSVISGRNKASSVFTVLSPKKDAVEGEEPADKKRASKDESQAPDAKKRKLFGGNVNSIFQTFD